MIPALERAREELIRQQSEIDATLGRLDRRIQFYERDRLRDRPPISISAPPSASASASASGAPSSSSTGDGGDGDDDFRRSNQRREGADDGRDDGGWTVVSVPASEEQQQQQQQEQQQEQATVHSEEEHSMAPANAGENAARPNEEHDRDERMETDDEQQRRRQPKQEQQEPTPIEPTSPVEVAHREAMVVVGTPHSQDEENREPDAKRRLVVTSVAVPLLGGTTSTSNDSGPDGGNTGVHWGEDWNEQQSNNAVGPAARRSRLLAISNPQIKQRNRKLFGFMQGYLQKSKSEAEEKTDQDKKRESIENKVEQSIKRDRSELDEAAIHRIQAEKSSQREQKENLIRQCDQIRSLIELIQTNEKQHRLRNFLRTDSKPSIYFLPRKLNANTNKAVEEQIRISQAQKSEIDATLSLLQKQVPSLAEFIAKHSENGQHAPDRTNTNRMEDR